MADQDPKKDACIFPFGKPPAPKTGFQCQLPMWHHRSGKRPNTTIAMGL
jgi:hypothetical protein